MLSKIAMKRRRKRNLVRLLRRDYMYHLVEGTVLSNRL